MIEKIISQHSGLDVEPGDIVDVEIDARIARDFGGANVVKNLKEHELEIDDPKRTYFTFDCNPGGSNPKYAANQQICRNFARERGINLYDINSGIGTHLAIDAGLIHPGGTLVSTDSHANILGAIGAFGQGMGDQDIAYVWSRGKIWFKVPPTIKLHFVGKPSEHATAKDLTLAALRTLGSAGLLNHAAELYGDCIDELNLSARITMSSMCTEMGGITALFPPNEAVLDYCRKRNLKNFSPVYADDDAKYAKTITVDVENLAPLCSRPGHPDDVVELSSVAGTKIDSGFIGSCTNGRYEDMVAAANVLEGKKLAPGVVLKIVPSTDEVWQMCLDDGILEVFKKAGAIVGNAGCAGCAAGQIGQNGPGEVTVSTGNRNYPGKQGKGSVYLASPDTVAASAVAGQLTTVDAIPETPAVFESPDRDSAKSPSSQQREEKVQGKDQGKAVFRGRAWPIDKDSIDTDMIYHNQHLTVTEVEQMGQFAFGNLDGYEDFAKNAREGDIVLVGANFGCGSSRQHAVECFRSLGVSVVVAKSFGAIYERNAINSGFPILSCDWTTLGIQKGDSIEVDLEEGTVEKIDDGSQARGKKASKVQLEIYNRGGLLANS